MCRTTAELEAQGGQTHAEDVEIVLACESHGAGQLMGLAKQVARRLRGLGRGHRRRLLGRAACRRLVGEPARALGRYGALGQPMLEGLERADGATELPPPLDVLDRHVESRLHGAEDLRRQREAPEPAQPRCGSGTEGFARIRRDVHAAHGQHEVRRDGSGVARTERHQAGFLPGVEQ
jgi:hypothetical protein